MAMLAFQSIPGMSKHPSCLFYSRLQNLNFSILANVAEFYQKFSKILAFSMLVHWCSIFFQCNSLRAHRPGGRTEIFYNSHTYYWLTLFLKCFFDLHATTGLPELLPNFSGDLVSLPKEVTHCTCAKELASPLLQMFLLLRINYEFLGTLCPSRMAMDLLITQECYFLFSSFSSSIHLFLEKKGKALSSLLSK